MNYYIEGNENPFLFNKDNYSLTGTHRKLKEELIEGPFVECGDIKQCLTKETKKEKEVDKVNILYLYVKVRLSPLNMGEIGFDMGQSTKISHKFLLETSDIKDQINKLRNECDVLKQKLAYFKNFQTFNLKKYIELSFEISNKEREIENLQGKIHIYSPTNTNYKCDLSNLDFNETSMYVKTLGSYGEIINISLIEDSTNVKFSFSPEILSAFTYMGYTVNQLNSKTFNLLNYKYLKIVVEYINKEHNSCVDIKYFKNKMEELQTKQQIINEISIMAKNTIDENFKNELNIKEEALAEELKHLNNTIFTSKLTTVLGLYKMTGNTIYMDDIKIPIDINSPFLLYFKDENDNIIDIENFIIHF